MSEQFGKDSDQMLINELEQKVKKLLSYDALTGNFNWLVSIGSSKSGSIAGSKHSDGYRHVMIEGKLYLNHRLAFLYMTGEFPPAQVDHINHNRMDNRWENLRPVTNRSNQRNQSIYKNNKSGCSGVHWSKCCQKWQAQISSNNKRVNLGLFPLLKDAVKARQDAEVVHGYHKNHGRSQLTGNNLKEGNANA